MRQSSVLSSFIAVLIILSTFYYVKARPILPEGVHSIKVGDFQNSLPNTTHEIMAYYDVDRDEVSDLIVEREVKEGESVQRYLSLYLWDKSEEFYHLEHSFNLGVLNVHSVVCANLFKPQQLDVLLTYQYIAMGQEEEQILDSQIYWSVQFIKIECYENCEFVSSGSVPELKKIDNSSPTLIILGDDINILYSFQGNAYTLSFNGELFEDGYTVLKLADSQFLNSGNLPLQQLEYKNSFFGDYNGDGIADLIISQGDQGSESSLIFFKFDLDLRKLSYETSVQIGTENDEYLQFFTLEDINYDGKIDLICLLSSGIVEVRYNVREDYDLILSTRYGKFVFDNSYDFENPGYSRPLKIQRIQLPFKPTETATVLMGDINNDGYEDFVIDLISDSYAEEEIVSSVLFINRGCSDVENCGISTFNSEFLETLSTFHIRDFEADLNAPLPVAPSSSTKMSFVDLYKDGKLDLIVQVLTVNEVFSSWSEPHKEVKVYFNNRRYDAFFMKIAIFKGDDYEEVHKNSNLIGGNVNCYVTSLSGQNLPKMSNQLTQIGQSMQLPYVFMGLGRSNNYVNDLYVTVPYATNESYIYRQKWTPIIPNSQLFILANSESKWQLQTFIEPTEKMTFVFILVVISLAGIGFWIYRLTKKEKQEDEENLGSFYSILR